MGRKRWQAKTEVTPDLLKFRERRKWQIALRRYVLERNSCHFYAPYFGLDIANLRKWLESQFNSETSWDDFGQKWQFSHIIPLTYFDFAEEKDLRMCWNFTNLRVEALQNGKNQGGSVDILGAKTYFRQLYEKTQYKPCLDLLERIDHIERSELISSERQHAFLLENRDYLRQIESYSSFEFELLNSGRPRHEVQKEIEFLRKYHN